MAAREMSNAEFAALMGAEFAALMGLDIESIEGNPGEIDLTETESDLDSTQEWDGNVTENEDGSDKENLDPELSDAELAATMGLDSESLEGNPGEADLADFESYSDTSQEWDEDGNEAENKAENEDENDNEEVKESLEELEVVLSTAFYSTLISFTFLLG